MFLFLFKHSYYMFQVRVSVIYVKHCTCCCRTNFHPRRTELKYNLTVEWTEHQDLINTINKRQSAWPKVTDPNADIPGRQQQFRDLLKTWRPTLTRKRNGQKNTSSLLCRIHMHDLFSIHHHRHVTGCHVDKCYLQSGSFETIDGPEVVCSFVTCLSCAYKAHLWLSEVNSPDFSHVSVHFEFPVRLGHLCPSSAW